MNTKLKAYSLIEVLVTLAIFSILMVMLGQSLLTNLQLSTKISARTQVRTSIDQTLSLLERDFRNADWLSGVESCGGDAATPGDGTPEAQCDKSCSMFIKNKRVVWCYQSAINPNNTNANAKGRILRFETTYSTNSYQNDPIIDIVDLDFSVNNSAQNSGGGNLAYANILITLQAQNASLGIKNQVKQLSITTRNYSIK